MRPVRDRQGVRIEESDLPGVLVNCDAGLLELVAQDRVAADLVDDLADASQEARVVDRQGTDVDAVAVELACLADESSGMGERTYGHRAVVGRHAAETVAGDQRRSRAQARGSQRGDRARWTGTDDDDVTRAIVRLEHRPMVDHPGRVNVVQDG